MHNVYLRSIQLCCCIKSIIWLRGVVLPTLTSIHISSYWIIYNSRFKSQNLEEKGFVMNKGCTLPQVCVYVYLPVCGGSDVGCLQQTCSVLHYASDSTGNMDRWQTRNRECQRKDVWLNCEVAFSFHLILFIITNLPFGFTLLNFDTEYREF